MKKTIYQQTNRITGLKKIRNKIFSKFAENCLIPSMRIYLYRLVGIQIGKNVFIARNCYIDDEVPGLITIEDDVVIGIRAIIVAHDDTGEKTAEPIYLRKGSYIGAGAIILPGVIVGANSIVGAGAVVVKNVEANTVVVGVPAFKIREANGKQKII